MLLAALGQEPPPPHARDVSICRYRTSGSLTAPRFAALLGGALVVAAVPASAQFAETILNANQGDDTAWLIDFRTGERRAIVGTHITPPRPSSAARAVRGRFVRPTNQLAASPLGLQPQPIATSIGRDLKQRATQSPKIGLKPFHRLGHEFRRPDK